MGERERLLDLSRREAAHATMDSGLADKSRLLEASLAEAEQKLSESEAKRAAQEQEQQQSAARREAELVRAQTRLELAGEEAAGQSERAADLAKLVADLEKRVSALCTDLEHEKNHSKNLLQKTNTYVEQSWVYVVCRVW